MTDIGARKHAVLFDLDGTLIDSSPDIALHLNGALAARGWREFSNEQIVRWIGNGARTLIRRALDAVGGLDIEATLPEIYADFIARYSELPLKHTTVYPGVAPTLEALRRAGHRLAIVTNKPAGISDSILRLLDWTALIECVIGGDTLPQRKPAPEPVWEACKRLGVDATHTVFVGDSDADHGAATAAGCPIVVGCTWGFRPELDHRAAGATHTIDAFDELVQIIP